MYKKGDKVKVKVMTDVVLVKSATIFTNCMFHSCGKDLYVVQFDDGTCDNAWNTQIALDTEEITC
jgi:hypothetical protein